MTPLDRLRALAALVGPDCQVVDAVGAVIVGFAQGHFLATSNRASATRWLLGLLEVADAAAAQALNRAHAFGEVQAILDAEAARDDAERRLREARALAAGEGP